MNEQNNISLPKNIKQMGSIDDSFKIYIEDYVFTYLQQYAKCSNGEERIAVLVGDIYTIDSKKVLFINGAIRGEHTVLEDGMLKFTDQSFDYIDQQISTYFEGNKIVGWFYSQPGFSDYINDGYINYHKQTFKEEDQVFFLSDPLENIGGFYKFKNNDFKIVNGFIIYYEKNEQMSEYMINNKIGLNKTEEEKFKQKDEKLISLSRQKSNLYKTKNTHTLKEYRKMSNVFSSLSAVLFLVCFIMGAGLIQSDDKINQLEKRLTKLDESYRYILSQMKDDSVQSVFAPNNDQNIETTSEQTTYAKTTTQQIEQTEQTTYTQTTQQTQQTTVTQPTTLATTQTTTQVDKTNLKQYTVKEGDSLELISKNFYGNRGKIEEIMLINNLDNPDKIYVGMTLLLP